LEKSNPVEVSARSLLKLVLGHLSHRAFVVQLWNGEQWGPEPEGAARFKLIFRNPNVVRNVFSNPSALTFGEAYIHGDLDVQGSLLEAFESGDQMLGM
jgi:cyclopropane-fatty-acyl-phospholipid synthase